ncbi:MerR family DNA-binding transcriptional regulator [Saccharopolyspora sp. NPDC000995]
MCPPGIATATANSKIPRSPGAGCGSAGGTDRWLGPRANSYRDGLDFLQVREVAERCGVGANALHYYERVGLLGPVGRDAARRRRYGEQAIAQVAFLNRMWQTGMTARTLRQCLDLMRAGEHAIDRHRKSCWTKRACSGGISPSCTPRATVTTSSSSRSTTASASPSRLRSI